MRSSGYQTSGKQRLVEFLCRNENRQFSVDELHSEMTAEGSEIGKSSLYRQLEVLCDKGAVRKFRDESRNCAVYQYVGKECDCGTHFHEQCTVCGKLNHLDCGDSAEFVEHLLRVHGFSVDRGRSILYGVCAACRAEGKGGVSDGARS